MQTQLATGIEGLPSQAAPEETTIPSATANMPLHVFATCPSSLTTPDRYLQRVAEAARWSEAAGCTGILVYTDNSLVDPWLVSQVIIQETRTLSPLVAVQPVYMHPYSVAKMISTVAFMHQRRVFLNMVAGGFKNDLVALNDKTPHDCRYQRLVEYTQIIQELLDGQRPVTFEGQFYRVENATLSPRMNADLQPGFYISGSSDAGMEAARTTGAVAVQYPAPPDTEHAGTTPQSAPRGIRIGILARPTEEEAWNLAYARFPEDRKGQLTRQFATKISDSRWHHSLAEIGSACNGSRETYWLRPFENYQTNCPYLVGSYERVAEVLAHYKNLGFSSYILDIPESEEEFQHTGRVFQMVTREDSSAITAGSSAL